MEPKVERRILSKAEVRTTKKGVIEGYAAVFGALSDPIPGGFREKIAPGTFSRAIREGQDVRCLFNHNVDLILGRTRSGTLALSQDSAGLAFECQVADTSAGRDVFTAIERRDIDGCSFSFATVEDFWSSDGQTRTLLDVNLFDVGPVTTPAYPQTSVAASRSAKGAEVRSGTYHFRRDVRSGLHLPEREDPEMETERVRARARLIGIEIERYWVSSRVRPRAREGAGSSIKLPITQKWASVFTGFPAYSFATPGATGRPSESGLCRFSHSGGLDLRPSSLLSIRTER